MKILVTGGAGYIGSITSLYFSLNSNHKLIVLDNLEKGSQEALDKIRYLSKKDISFVKADIRNLESMKRVFKYYRPDSIMHFAAYKSVPESNENPKIYYENNVNGTINLLKVAKEYNIKKFTFSSTAAVYGDSEEMPLNEDSYKNPKSVYGKTKLEMENQIYKYFNNKNINAYIFRFFNVIGASKGGKLGENPNLISSFVPLVIQKGLGIRDSLTIFGNKFNTKDGSQLRDYISVNDIARAHLMVVNSKQKSGIKTYNLSTSSPNSCLEVINRVEKILQKKIDYSIGEPRKGDIVTSYASNSKIISEVNWRPKESFNTSLKNQIKWFKENPQGFIY